MPARIDVLVVGPEPASPRSRGGMATLIAHMRDHRDPRVRIRTVATYVDGNRATRLRIGVTGMLWSTLLVLFGRVDVLHVHLAHRGSVVRKSAPLLAARLTGTPAVVHAHSYDFAGWFDGLGERGRRVVQMALRADRWFVLGEDLAVQYGRRLQLDDATLRVFRNPVELPSAPQRSETSTVGVVSLGRLGSRKGSYDVIHALAAMAPDVRRRLTVTLAGDGEVDGVRAAAVAAGVDDILTVRSWVGPDERDALLAGAEIFVLPSYEEGLPMALLEAMAWGLVPVTTPVGGIPDVVTDGVDGVLLTPGATDALAAALTRLAVDREWRTDLGDAARRTAGKYALGAWFDELIIEWSALSANSRRGRRR